MQVNRFKLSCHWPEPLNRSCFDVFCENENFVGGLCPSNLLAGYTQLFWAGSDEVAVKQCIQRLVAASSGPLHITIPGPSGWVENMIDWLKEFGFSLKDMHVEMKNKRLPVTQEHEQVKHAEAAHISGILSLLNTIFPDYQIVSEIDLHQQIRANDHGVFVVEVDSRVVGAIAGMLYGDNYESLFVETLAVIPEYRGRGLGQALLETLIAWADRKGASRSMLWLLDGSAIPALRLYEKYGWQDTGGREAELIRD